MRLRAPRWLIAAVCIAVLLAVFSLYARPQFMVGLAEQVWACIP